MGRYFVGIKKKNSSHIQKKQDSGTTLEFYVFKKIF